MAKKIDAEIKIEHSKVKRIRHKRAKEQRVVIKFTVDD